MRLAVEAIVSFNVQASNGQKPTTSYDSPTSAGTIYLSDVATRLACICQGICPNVVHMVNDSGILMVSPTGGKIICVVS